MSVAHKASTTLAVAVLTEASGFNTALIEELRELQNCEDWTMTAAVHLLPGSCKQEKEGRPPSGPLAAPLPCNQSQEEVLEHLRRAPLTIVTGPPGTGKTQLVVNAVTNAWLDGEKVLVTSTNNAAVDVAVARAETDVFSGLLMRTGNRTVREQVPDRITVASEQAAAHTGDPAEARARLKRSAVERSRLIEKLALLDKLDTALLRVAEWNRGSGWTSKSTAISTSTPEASGGARTSPVTASCSTWAGRSCGFRHGDVTRRSTR